MKMHKIRNMVKGIDLDTTDEKQVNTKIRKDLENLIKKEEKVNKFDSVDDTPSLLMVSHLFACPVWFLAQLNLVVCMQK